MRVGVDVGGTFTDFVFVQADGSLGYHKVPSTPDDPSRAILQGLADIRGDRPVEELVHGSTVATNAVLERKGARTGLVATAGFGGAFFIGRQVRPDLYDLDLVPPRPLVEAGDVVEAAERMDAAGQPALPLTDPEAERVAAAVAALGVRSVAVALLFSYVDPSHEERLACRLRARGLHVSASAEVVREYREYERTATTVVNAYVAPVMEAYLARLEDALPTRRFRIMQSNGGQMAPDEARRRPVHTILSGPAGGVAGASATGRQAGFERFVTFDMGGTSTDVALHDGGVGVTSESAVEGFPLRVPVLDIHTVGAGGGSLARLDAGGALVVGPESAGADPGPACYGRGLLPAVTDANLVLGRLSERHFLGGRMVLHRERALRAVATLAERLGRPVDEVAAGIVRVVNSGMERALRVISVERGHDVRDFALLCFGGSGGLHAADLAAALDMPHVIVPTSPGTLSALGALNADVVKELSRTVLGIRTDDAAGIEGALAELEGPGRAALGREGFAADAVRSARSLEVRYAGQSYELSVPFGPDFAADFHARHQRRFGHCSPAAKVEVVGVRVRLTVPTPPVLRPAVEAGGADPAAARVGAQPCWLGGWQDVPLYDRARLRPGMRVPGPAIVVEFTSTTLVQPGMSARVDGFGNLIIAVRRP